jgi:hypothetical protein
MAQTLERNGNNMVDEAKVAGYLEKVERVLQEIASEQGAYMARVKSLKADINGILDQAKDVDGIPKKEFKDGIDILQSSIKLRKKLTDKESDQRHMILAIIGQRVREELGDFADLPLGAAAVDAASGGHSVDESLQEPVWADLEQVQGRRSRRRKSAADGASEANGATAAE